MIQPLEGTFSSFDGRKLFYRYYLRKESRATLVILHGHGEHSGRYENFFPLLESLNISIAVYDFRGHGRSEGPEVFISNFNEYLNDVTSFVSFLEKEYGLSGKILLLGHSIGGLTAVYWALQHPQKIRGLVLSSPCLGLRLPNFLIQFNSLLNRMCPTLLYQNPVYPPHLTHNTEEVKTYRKDAYIKRKMSVSLLAESLKWMRQLESVPSFEFPFPVFILMAGLEKVVDAEKTCLFFDKLKAPHKEIKVFEGFYHEIFNELGQEKVFDALKANLQKALSFS